MSTISLLLNCSPDHPIESFEWGLAVIPNILYRGVVYDRVEVDFTEGEVRFWKDWIPNHPGVQLATFRKSINAALQSPPAYKPPSFNVTDDTIDDDTPVISTLHPHDQPEGVIYQSTDE